MPATMPAPRVRMANGRKAVTRGPIDKVRPPSNVRVAEAQALAARSVTDTWGLHRNGREWVLVTPAEVVPGDRLVGRDGWMIQV